MPDTRSPELQAFLNLCAQANSEVKTRIYPEERARIFQPILDHVLAHPSERRTYVQAFREIIFGFRGVTDDLVRHCMRQLQWSEVADAVRERMSQEIHNSEYESLQELLDVYDHEVA
jgi:hypothetical protein